MHVQDARIQLFNNSTGRLLLYYWENVKCIDARVASQKRSRY